MSATFEGDGPLTIPRRVGTLRSPSGGSGGLLAHTARALGDFEVSDIGSGGGTIFASIFSRPADLSNFDSVSPPSNCSNSGKYSLPTLSITFTSSSFSATQLLFTRHEALEKPSSSFPIFSRIVRSTVEILMRRWAVYASLGGLPQGG